MGNVCIGGKTVLCYGIMHTFTTPIDPSGNVNLYHNVIIGYTPWPCLVTWIIIKCILNMYVEYLLVSGKNVGNVASESKA